MKDKDFGQAVRDILSSQVLVATSSAKKIGKSILYDGKIENISVDEATTRILALCKEMLVPARSLSGVKIIEVGVFEPFEDGPEDIGWNACRSELLKQLGEKI